MAGPGDWKKFPHRWLLDNCPEYKKPFDLNSELTAKLVQLEQINKEKDIDADQVLILLRQINAEYTALVSTSQKLVDKMKGPFEELKTRNLIEPASYSVSEQVKAKQALISNLKTKMENMRLDREKFKIRKELQLSKEKTAELCNKTVLLKSEVELAKKELDEKAVQLVEEEEAVDAEIRETDLILKELQDQMEKLGVTENMIPETLLRDVAELENLKEEMEDLKAKLAKYMDLPPDIIEARKVVKQARLEETKIAEKVKEHLAHT